MNINKILGNFVGKKPIKQRQQLKPARNSFQNDFDFKKPKPIKEFKLADKPIQVFNNNPIPSRKTIEQAYKRIPDDTTVPLQFMTREQYLKKYVTNQEIINGKPFCPVEKRKHINEQKQDYKNIIGRYTTENNQYYKPAVVIFNDKDNFKNIKGKNFAPLVWHEFGHEYVEDKGWDIPIHKEEMFADKVAMNKTLQKQIINEYKKGNIKRDNESKNRSKPNKLMQQRIDKLPLYFATVTSETDEDDPESDIEFTTLRDKDAYKIKGNKTARNTLIGNLKRNPQIISELEKRPDTTLSIGDESIFKYEQDWVGGIAVPQFNNSNVIEGTNIFLRKEKDFDKPSDDEPALLGFKLPLHELKHSDQHRGLTKEQYDEQNNKYMGDKVTKERYVTNQYEVEADKFAYEKFAEKYGYMGDDKLTIAETIRNYDNDLITEEEMAEVAKPLKQKRNQLIEQNKQQAYQNIFSDEDSKNLKIAQASEKKQAKYFEQKKKPILMTADPYIKLNQPYLETNRPSWVIRDKKTGKITNKGPTTKIYYHPETKQNAIKAKQLLNKNENKNAKDIKYHVEMGKLLGYSDKEINSFVNKLNKLPLKDKSSKNLYLNENNIPTKYNDLNEIISEIQTLPIENDGGPEQLQAFQQNLIKHPYLIDEIKKSPIVRIVIDKDIQDEYADAFIIPSTLGSNLNEKGEEVFNKFSIHISPHKVDDPLAIGHELEHAKHSAGKTGLEFQAHTEAENIFDDPEEYAAEYESTRKYVTNTFGITDPAVIDVMFKHGQGLITDKEYQEFKNNHSSGQQQQQPQHQLQPQEDNLSKNSRYNKVTRKIGKTIYENPEGRKITVFDKGPKVPTVDDVSYFLDNLPKSMNVADVNILNRRKYAELEESKDPGYSQFYKDIVDKEPETYNPTYVDLMKKQLHNKIIFENRKSPAFFNQEDNTINIVDDEIWQPMFNRPGVNEEGYNEDDAALTKYVLAHEEGHAIDKSKDNKLSNRFSYELNLITNPPPSNYALKHYEDEKSDSGYQEDVAESFAQRLNVVPERKYSVVGKDGKPQFERTLDSPRKQILDEELGEQLNEPTALEEDLAEEDIAEEQNIFYEE